MAAVNCRNTGRRGIRTQLVRGALVASLLGLIGAGTSELAGFYAPEVGATTPTTTPGPAPNQSQINATQSQVASIESTLTQEEEQTQLLDNRYDTALENLQSAQTALQTITAAIGQTKSKVAVDRQHLTNDAIKAYIFGTPQTQFASLFSSSATLG
ncbi:MAG TPA: hypothetical protein VGH31_12325, partial [Acidimicrobiales bacterium]